MEEELSKLSPQMTLALHKLACEVDDLKTNRTPVSSGLSGIMAGVNASGDWVHAMQYVESALAELRRTGWTPGMLGVTRWIRESETR